MLDAFINFPYSGFDFVTVGEVTTVDVAPEVNWNPENGNKILKVTVECEAHDAVAEQKAADAELQSRLKYLAGSLKIAIGRGLEVNSPTL